MYDRICVRVRINDVCKGFFGWQIIVAEDCERHFIVRIGIKILQRPEAAAVEQSAQLGFAERPHEINAFVSVYAVKGLPV